MSLSAWLQSFDWTIWYFVFSICDFQGTMQNQNRNCVECSHSQTCFDFWFYSVPAHDRANLFARCIVQVHFLIRFLWSNGDGEIRTLDPLLARQVLSQLSYTPILDYSNGLYTLMGLSGLEPPTSRLSGVRSNQLSYKPFYNLASTCSPTPSPVQYHRPLRS